MKRCAGLQESVDAQRIANRYAMREETKEQLQKTRKKKTLIVEMFKNNGNSDM